MGVGRNDAGQVSICSNGSFPPTETDSDPWDGDLSLKCVQ